MLEVNINALMKITWSEEIRVYRLKHFHLMPSLMSQNLQQVLFLCIFVFYRHLCKQVAIQKAASPFLIYYQLSLQVFL